MLYKVGYASYEESDFIMLEADKTPEEMQNLIVLAATGIEVDSIGCPLEDLLHSEEFVERLVAAGCKLIKQDYAIVWDGWAEPDSENNDELSQELLGVVKIIKKKD